MSELIQATSRTVKTMADGTLRLTLDISPIHAQSAFTLFGMPDAPVVLARLTQEAATTHAQNETIGAEMKGGLLSKWLAIRNYETEFHQFVNHITNRQDIDAYGKCNFAIKKLLNIQSKKELDHDKEAEQRFHEMIRLPYAKWLAGKR